MILEVTKLHMPPRFSAREKILFTTSAILACALVFGGRSLPEVSAREKGDSSLFQELKVFTDVLSLVKRDYVSPVDNKKIVEGAIKGLLTTLDPHSGYLDPEYYQDIQVQTKGEFGGLGIEITIKDGLLVVVAPMEGSPAEKVGVRAGDIIVKIDGKYTKEFSLVDAVKRLRGPKGSPITISVSRKGLADLFDVTIVRDNIAVKSVKSRYLGDGFGYVRISQFMEHTSDDLKAALSSLVAQSEQPELKGLVLDMRNNPGGLLAQAVQVGDLFLKEGIIVYTDGRVEAQKQKFFAKPRGTEPEYPIIVLVNGGSASASEIVAGALKDHGRALVLGTQTFGKGSVQTITPLENGGALTLTTALYYTKSGNSIQARGVKPDIEVQLPDAVVEPAGERAPLQEVREEDLPGAINNPSASGNSNGVAVPAGESGDVLRKINKTPTVRADVASINPEKVDLAEWARRDIQFQRATDLLKTFSVFKAPGA
jgi:carboxyl-terminal processing protease